MRSLTQDPVRAGVANLQARTGRAYSDLVGDWLLATLLDDVPPTRAAPYSLPSWNLPTILTGMNVDLSASFPIHFPFHERTVGYGTIAIPVAALHGGTASIVHIVGLQSTKQLIEILSPTGGPPPAGLHLQIVRTL
jgi:hypothetical protein